MPELMLKPTRERTLSRLKCRFKIDPAPRSAMGKMRWMERLEREKVRIAEQFVADMGKTDRLGGRWEHVPSYGFKMRGPFPMVGLADIKVPHIPTAREMQDAVRRGERFLDTGRDYAKPMPTLGMSEYWEFEISGVFAREEIQVEYADRHEEERP